MEGPASILKELAENALDAGADVLELEMEKDPSQGLRVQDNGKGMGPQELQLALKRHATSKIQKAQDLFLVQPKIISWCNPKVSCTCVTQLVSQLILQAK